MSVEILGSIAWPLAILLGFLVFIIVFRKAIHERISQLTRFRAEVGSGKSIEMSAESKSFMKEAIKATQEANQESLKKVLGQLLHGDYCTNAEAFSTASRRTIDYLSKNADKELTLDIKMTVVGMAYSWTGFLDNIPAWLKENDRCHINVNVLLSDPAYLNDLSISKTPRNWADESSKRIFDMTNMIESLPPSLRKRINSTFKFYKSIPQYHGILINNQDLYLGRTDWEFYDDDRQKAPKLTVGENRYRYFDKDTNIGYENGLERVNLFLHWHKWYWNYFSTSALIIKDGVLVKIQKHHKEEGI